VEITAKVLAEDKKTALHEAVAAKELPENMAEAIKWGGEAQIFSGFMADYVIDLQALMRSNLKKGVTGDALVKLIADHRPGVKQPRRAVDVKAAFLAKFKAGSKEEKAELLKELHAMLKV
jgi:hypothetical protein